MSTFLVLVASGVAAAVIGGLILARLEKFPWRRARVQLAPVAPPAGAATRTPVAPPVEEASRTPVHHLTLTVGPAPAPSPLDEVMRQMASLTPFQRDQMASHYVGLCVHVNGFLASIRQVPKDEMRVAIRTAGEDVFFNVPLAHQPFFKIMPEDHPIRVEGTIERIWAGVELTNVQLSYPPLGPSLGKGS